MGSDPTLSPDLFISFVGLIKLFFKGRGSSKRCECILTQIKIPAGWIEGERKKSTCGYILLTKEKESQVKTFKALSELTQPYRQSPEFNHVDPTRFPFYGEDAVRSLLVSDPFPEPKSNLPVSIRGKRYGVPFRWEPSAKMDDPKTVRKEKTKTPTMERRRKTKQNKNHQRYWAKFYRQNTWLLQQPCTLESKRGEDPGL